MCFHHFQVIDSLSFEGVVVTRQTQHSGGNFLVVDVGCCVIEKCTLCSSCRVQAFPAMQSADDLVIPIETITKLSRKKFRSERGTHQKGKTSIGYTTEDSQSGLMEFKMGRWGHAIFHENLVNIWHDVQNTDDRM